MTEFAIRHDQTVDVRSRAVRSHLSFSYFFKVFRMMDPWELWTGEGHGSCLGITCRVLYTSACQPEFMADHMEGR